MEAVSQKQSGQCPLIERVSIKKMLVKVQGRNPLEPAWFRLIREKKRKGSQDSCRYLTIRERCTVKKRNSSVLVRTGAHSTAAAGIGASILKKVPQKPETGADVHKPVAQPNP